MAAETEFTAEQLQDSVKSIKEDLMQSEDGWNEKKIINALINGGMLKNVHKDPIEVVNIGVV